MNTRRTRTNRRTTQIVAALTGAAVVLGGTGAALATQDTQDGTTDVPDALLFHLEEERMARDLYDALGEAHDGLMPFERIEVSEQRHRDAVARLITLKGGTLPAEEIPGVYENAEIQQLYDDWLARGLTSPQEAFQVGIELEIADIDHLRSTIEELDDADVDRVLGHLLSASENHLAAFEKAANRALPIEQPGQPGDPGQPGKPGQPGQGRGPEATPPSRQGPGAGAQNRQDTRGCDGTQARQHAQDCDGAGTCQCDGAQLRQRQGQQQGPGQGQGKRQGTGDCPLTDG